MGFKSRKKDVPFYDGKTRELGKISDVFIGKENHGIMTCNVTVDFDGTIQGFCGLVLDEELVDDFVSDLCSKFGVGDAGDLIGMSCVAYRCFSGWNEPIEALGPPGEPPFELWRWRQKHWSATRDPLSDRREKIQDEIERLDRRIGELETEQRKLDDRYVPIEWRERSR